jgi:hypothetical protein
MSDSQKRSTFSLNLKSQKAIDFLESDKEKAGLTKTTYLNELILAMADLCITFSGEDGSTLDEILALKELLNDQLMRQIPELAIESRRTPVQMMLYLMQKGMEADNQSQVSVAELTSVESRVALNRQEKVAAA